MHQLLHAIAVEGPSIIRDLCLFPPFSTISNFESLNKSDYIPCREVLSKVLGTRVKYRTELPDFTNVLDIKLCAMPLENTRDGRLGWCNHQRTKCVEVEERTSSAETFDHFVDGIICSENQDHQRQC